LATGLEICATLQSTKNIAVSNTAAATIQQIVVSVFDKVATEDSNSKSPPCFARLSESADRHLSSEVNETQGLSPTGRAAEKESVINSAAYDALRVSSLVIFLVFIGLKTAY
jgi:hypothetical protein